MWFITAVKASRESIGNPTLLVDTHRTFGFYKERSNACEAIDENRGNMQECLYNFLVLEELAEGIHPEVRVELWYKWDEQWRRWIPCNKPSDLEGIINWALG